MSDDIDIWRPFFPRTWKDARVTVLSRPPPNGQTLLTWLFVGPQTGLIPGVFEIGERAFAELLGWPLGGEPLLGRLPQPLPQGFREAFAEVAAQGWVKADWDARLVYVPSGIRKPGPANQNVVKGWRAPWRLLPECALKDEIAQDFRQYMKQRGEPFAEAFEHVLSNGMANKVEGRRNKVEGGGKRASAPTPPALEPIETLADARATQVSTTEAHHLADYWQANRQRVRKIPGVIVIPGATIDSARKVLGHANGDMAMAKRAVDAYLADDREFYVKKHWPLYLLADPKDFETHVNAPFVKTAKAAHSDDALAKLRAAAEEDKARRAARGGGDASAT